ncbi:MAG: potassium-transporting ATPase subunit KdpA, partial [Burkholderiales bacterium]|nr:potassium-transporting ATPase subunit KdpA [Burkholderiales bacterium]
MSANTVLQPALFIVVLIALAIPAGRYMAAVFDGSSVLVRRIGKPVERLLYKVAGVDENAEMSWQHYALAVLAFNALGALVLYGFLRLQQWLPANPQAFGPMTPDAAFNTAVSFVTNTNWQDYTPEATVSYLTQMAGLTVQNFMSAATGIAVVVALIRGF